jgi:uncharacterized spore protein YtfJ
MSEEQKQPEGVFSMDVASHEDAFNLINRLHETARPNAAFSEPLTSGDYTVITASEVHVGLGVGFGSGMGQDDDGSTGGGTGGGGGGAAGARPIAMIEIGPAGARVEPIVDPTKIVLAFFTTLGAMFIALSRMKRSARKLGR